MDFTLTTYRQLLLAFKQANYNFITFEEYCLGKANNRSVILRHDVDIKAGHSHQIALIESELYIRSSYYFRVIPQSNQPEIIKSIASLGHEIGYHYEDLSLFKGDSLKALEHFKTQLAYFRTYYPVKTICMHGSPTSNYDNRDIWKSADYKDYGIIGEPYFDVDFDKIFYLTDTGRCWDGEKYSVRDKVSSIFQQTYHSTTDIIHAINNGEFPTQVMITTHPQRWTDKSLEWIVELVMQRIKNLVKLLLVKR